MRTQSVLSKSFTISLLLHAGLLAGLVLFVSRSPVVSNTPLRVRILEEPAPQAAPQTPVPVAPPQQAGRERVEPPRRGGERGKPQVLTERLSPKPVPAPDKPAAPSPPAPPPPQVVARPAPEVPAPAPKTVEPPPAAPPATPRETPREAVREPLPPAAPERSGLFLGGSSTATTPRPPASSEPTGKGASRPSLRDQIASLTSNPNIVGEAGEAKRTINLDDRQPEFLPYLERLKRRVYNVWTYPREAGELGLGGEVELIFTLNKSGTLTSLRLVHSSGFPVLDDEALRAIREAAPFDPFPAQMGTESWNIRGFFHYVSARYRRN